jgi:hypothetical protein
MVENYDEVLLDWKNCPETGCKNKICLALKSDKCFPHTQGSRQWKLFKIWCNNFIKNFI